MAGTTPRFIPVVARIVATRVMAECSGRPGVSVMAFVALYIRGNMACCRLRGRTTTCAMARFADADRTRIVRPGAAYKGSGGMAGAAIQAGRKMILRLAG
jgi:hypothetical protein